MAVVGGGCNQPWQWLEGGCNQPWQWLEGGVISYGSGWRGV